MPKLVPDARAESAGVSELCRFEVGDLRQAFKARRRYDVAVLAAVGAIGDHARTVLEMRRIVRPRLVPTDELVESNRINTELIRRRAAELAARAPELAEALERYVQSEVEECAFLESRTTAAIWLLERN